ncbi:MAG: tetratricopeptide repeat protein, partial [Alphaproteobacteria bacterium]|nr:tetratricopeptide repeat protein [Alphaproteobacteria bacterium]
KIEDNIFAFHDAHYGMALAAVGRRDDVAALIGNMEKAATREDTTEAPIYRDVGIPLCRAIDAYGAGDYAAAVDHLLPVRRQVYRIGGSHAQRDLFFRLLVVSALHTRQFRLARALLAERNALNPNSVWGLKRVAVALEGMGDSAEAAKARARADKLLAA